jgi:hypothetical protein
MSIDEASCRRLKSKSSIVGAGVITGGAGAATAANAIELEPSSSSVEERIVTTSSWYSRCLLHCPVPHFSVALLHYNSTFSSDALAFEINTVGSLTRILSGGGCNIHCINQFPNHLVADPAHAHWPKMPQPHCRATRSYASVPSRIVVIILVL